jgi:hypothetical protein
MSDTAQKPSTIRFEELANNKHFSDPKHPAVICRKIKHTIQGQGPARLGFNAITVRHPRRHCIGYAEEVPVGMLVIEVQKLPPLPHRKKNDDKKRCCCS